jgi:hypothetical protein
MEMENINNTLVSFRHQKKINSRIMYYVLKYLTCKAREIYFKIS